MVKSQKKWWALYDKWEIWIDTSWLALYNALRFEKMQKRFISEHTFYINCFTLLIVISIDPFLLRLEIIFQVFIMVQSWNWSLCTSTKKSRKIRVFFTIFWANDFSHFLTLVKSKVSDTYTLLTLGKAMCSFTWKNKNVSLIREDSLILTKRKELNEISYVLWFIE